jgi:hypothetical protein
LDRLLPTQILPAHQQARLLALRRSINPLDLRNQLHALIDKLFALPLAGNTSQDVNLTLFSQETAIAQ